MIAAALGAGFFYLYVTPPTYTAHAQIITDIRKGQFFENKSLIADTPVDSNQVENQLLILSSDTLAIAVIKDLHLLENRRIRWIKSAGRTDFGRSALTRRYRFV